MAVSVLDERGIKWIPLEEPVLDVAVWMGQPIRRDTLQEVVTDVQFGP
jgi:hypothetical protein